MFKPFRNPRCDFGNQSEGAVQIEFAKIDIAQYRLQLRFDLLPED